MAGLHIKTNEEVVAIAGAERGKRGKVLKVYPERQRAIVEGLNVIKKHVRKNQRNPEGAIIEREGTIHISNLMSAKKFDARAAKRGGPEKTDEE